MRSSQTGSGGSYVATGVFGLAVGALAWIDARSFPLSRLDAGLGPAFFPWLVLTVITLLSLSAVVYGLMQGVRFNFPFQAGNALASTALLFAALCAFALLFASFGLLIPVILFLIVSMRLLGAPWLHATGIGTATGFALHLLFVEGFGVVMP